MIKAGGSGDQYGVLSGYQFLCRERNGTDCDAVLLLNKWRHMIRAALPDTKQKPPGDAGGFAFLMRGEIVSCSTILINIIKGKCVQNVSTSL